VYIYYDPRALFVFVILPKVSIADAAQALYTLGPRSVYSIPCHYFSLNLLRISDLKLIYLAERPAMQIRKLIFEDSGQGFLKGILLIVYVS
jgi:hypothetical protein